MKLKPAPASSYPPPTASMLLVSLVLSQAELSRRQLVVADVSVYAAPPVAAAVSFLLSRTGRHPVVVVIAHEIAVESRRQAAVRRRPAVPPSALPLVRLTALPLVLAVTGPTAVLLVTPLLIRQSALLHTVFPSLFCLPERQR